MRWFILLLVSSCTHYAGDDDDCGRAPTVQFAPTELRSPFDLHCETYGQGCDPACGNDCGRAFEAAPSWGICYAGCEVHRTEAECAADSACRVVDDAACAVSPSCSTSFVGCYSIDMKPDETIDCFTADAWNCSRNNICMALHSIGACSHDYCARPFELCLPEGTTPGRCHDPVACDAAPPGCPTGTTPGVSEGCYTGACIPIGLCP